MRSSSGGNSGSQATSLLIRSLALHEVRLRDWWRVAVRELPTGIVLGVDRGLVRRLLVAVSAQPRRGDRRTFRHPHDLERQDALEQQLLRNGNMRRHLDTPQKSPDRMVRTINPAMRNVAPR